MGRIIRLTERDLTRLVKRVIQEQQESNVNATEDKEKQNSLKWKEIVNALGRRSYHHYRSGDNYTLAFGKLAGRTGFDWGMTISKSGEFDFETTNKQKWELLSEYRYSGPLSSLGDSMGFSQARSHEHYRAYTRDDGSIYDVEAKYFISFVNTILDELNKMK